MLPRTAWLSHLSRHGAPHTLSGFFCLILKNIYYLTHRGHWFCLFAIDQGSHLGAETPSEANSTVERVLAPILRFFLNENSLSSTLRKVTILPIPSSKIMPCDPKKSTRARLGAPECDPEVRCSALVNSQKGPKHKIWVHCTHFLCKV